MIRCLAVFLGICCTIVLAEDDIDWPPRNLEGAWRVIRVSEDNPPDNVEVAKLDLLIIIKDYLIFTDVFSNAFGRPLSDGEAHTMGYRANTHVPTVTIDLAGGRKNGTSKDPITFAIGKDPTATLDVTMDNLGAGLRIHAERISADDARKMIDRLLADPNFRCDTAKIRALLKSYANQDRKSRTNQ